MKKLQEEWEKTLFWTMLVALLGTLAFWAFHRDEGGTKSSDNKMKTRASFLGETPYAFLDDSASERIPDNPFSYGYKPQQKRPWHRPTGSTPTPRTATPRPRTPTTKPAQPAPKPVPTAKPTPAKPAAPPPARILTYRGYLEGTTGTQLAFVKVTDPATKKNSMVRLEVGRKIAGIEVKAFTGETLEVVDPKGKPLRIARGSKRKIVLE